MPDLGEKLVGFGTNEKTNHRVRFRVADVVKPLLSAGKVAEAGYEVNLNSSNPHLKCKRTGKVIKLRKWNGVFVLDMWLNTAELGPVFSRPGR